MNPKTGHLKILWAFLLTTSIVIFQGSNVSSQSIFCQEEGIFQLEEYCDVYRKCEPWRRNRLRNAVVVCPDGTVFDPERKTCLDPYLVTSRPECMPVVTTTTTVAPTPETLKCDEEGMFPLEEYCDAYYTCDYSMEGILLSPAIDECPFGTVFDDEKDSCLDPYLVTSRPECMPEEHLQTSATGFQSVINEVESSNVWHQFDDAETVTEAPLPSQEEVVGKTNVIVVTSDMDDTTPKTAVPSDPQYPNRAPSEPQYPNRVPSDPQYPNRAHSEPQYPNRAPSEPQYPNRVPSDPQHPNIAPSDPQYPNRAHSDPQYPNRAHSEPQYPNRVPSDPQYPNRVPSDPQYPNIAPSEVTTETYIDQGIYEATTETYIPQVITNVPTETYITEETIDTGAGNGDNDDISQMIQEVARISRQTCQNVCIIGRYVSLTTSTVPLHVAHHRPSTFKTFLESYNSALETSRNTVHIWDSGNDILSNVRRIFNLAKKYELEFDRKYKIYNGRATSSSSSQSSMAKRKTELREDIEMLQEDMRYRQEIMATSSETIRVLISKQIQRNTHELERKKQVLHELLNSSGFTSPGTFLVMVINEARNIENITNDLKTRIATWYTNLSENKAVLDDKAVRLNQQNENLKTMIQNKKNTIIQKQKNISDLQDEKSTLDLSLTNLEGEIDTNLKELKAKNVAFVKKINKMCDLPDIKKHLHDVNVLPIPDFAKKFFSMLIVGRHLVNKLCPHLDLTPEYKKLQQLQISLAETNDEKMNKINTDSTRINTIQESVSQMQTEVQRLRSMVRNLEAESRRLQSFMGQQGRAKQAWLLTTRAIPAMINDLGKVGITFRSIYVNLEELLSHVPEDQKTATGENNPNFKEVRNAIAPRLELLQTQIDKSSVNIQEIVDCPQVMN